MLRRIVVCCCAWLMLSGGGWGLALRAGAAPACPGSGADLIISAPTALDGLRLSGQRVRVAADLAIAGRLEGCAASFELLPGARLTAASIDLEATTASIDRARLLSSGPLRLSSQRLLVGDGPGQPALIGGDGAVELTGAAELDLRAVGDRASLIRAGGDLVLRSGRPIRGDAHYLAGGAVRMETLRGAPADVFSPDDPLVLARFDVSIGNYSGASLHVLAGGRVSLGAVTINGVDTQTNSINPSNTTFFNPTTRIQALAPVPLTASGTVTVAGNLRPTLDVRAGINWSSLGGLGSNQIIPGGGVAPTFGGSSSDAAINVTSVNVAVPNGVVLLTNQYRPNPALSGGITAGNILAPSSTIGVNGGDVMIDSRGGVATGQLQTSANAAGSSGGSIWVRAAAGNIVTGPHESRASSSGDTGAGGAIAIAAPAGSVQVSGLINTSTSTGSGRSGVAGAVSITAGGAITGPPQIYTNSAGSTGSAAGGAVSLTSSGPIDLSVIHSYSHMTGASPAGSGNAGPITLLARNAGAVDGADSITLQHILADSGSAITSGTGPSANGGAVSIRAEDGPITVREYIWTPSVARGGASHAGNGGLVALTAGNGGISLGSFGVATYSQAFGNGNAGRGGNASLVASGPITINADGLSGGINASSNASGNAFGGGNVLVFTNQGAITVGDNNIDSSVTSDTGSAGNGGNVTIAAAAAAAGSIKSNAILSRSTANTAGASAGSGGRISLSGGGPLLIRDSLYAYSSARLGKAGSGGDVTVTTAATATLRFIQTYADSTSGAGDGGDVTVETAGRLKIDQISAWTRFSGSGYAGDAGDTRITVRNSGAPDGGDDLELGSVWSDSGTWYHTGASGPSGDGGASILTVEDGDALIAQWLWGQSQSRGDGFASGDGGEVTVRASGQIRFGDFGINTTSQAVNGPAGDAGAVTLEAGGAIRHTSPINFLIWAESLSASGAGGNGGTISVTTTDSIDFKDQELFSRSLNSGGSSGNGGAITLAADIRATAAITAGELYSHSQGGQGSGDGGAISVRGGRVTTSHLHAYTLSGNGMAGSGGAISVTADIFPATDVDLYSHSQGSAGAGAGGPIALSAGGPLALRTIGSFSRVSSNGVSGAGGAISIRSLNRGALDGGDAITLSSLLSDSGGSATNSPVEITAGAGGAVSVEAADGPISVAQSIFTTSASRNGASTASDGGDVTLTAPRGSISIASTLGIVTDSEADGSSGAAGRGGRINIQAGGDVTLPAGAVVSATSSAAAGATGGGGAISIDVQGAINAPDVTFQSVSRTTGGQNGPGGDLSLRAGGTVEVGALRSASTRASGQNGAAGDIRVVTPAAVTVASADASAGGAQPGPAGTVEIEGATVRLTGATSGASVLASGLAATGAISITHGGGGVTPFIVGDPAANGSAGALRTGAASIEPTRSFLYSHTEAPNIHIIVGAPATKLYLPLLIK